jgi:hypothetical protein
MIIEFRRAMILEDVTERECAWCARPHQAETVVIVANGLMDDGSTLGVICPNCLAYLAETNPESFPSVEQYEVALQRYPEPVFASIEEATRVSEEDDQAFEEAYDASWLPPARH